MTLTQDITITLTPPVNLRDLGGTPVSDGVVAHGFALRSDDLATITADAADQLVNNGLRSVIDLRSRDEVFVTGRGPLLDKVVNYHHVPLMSSIRDATGTVTPEAAVLGAAAPTRILDAMPPMSDMYVAMFENSAAALVSSLAIMAHSQGATAFHCAAGKDRTGTLAAALLLALGADDATIIADYRATYPNLAGISARTGTYIHHVMALAGYDLDTLREQLDAAKETARSEQAMADTLCILRDKYTDPLLPLRKAGLSNALIQVLRERAVVA